MPIFQPVGRGSSGSRRAEGTISALEGHKQGVVSTSSAHILLFNRESPSHVELGTGKCGLCPGSQMLS